MKAVLIMIPLFGTNNLIMLVRPEMSREGVRVWKIISAFLVAYQVSHLRLFREDVAYPVCYPEYICRNVADINFILCGMSLINVLFGIPPFLLTNMPPDQLLCISLSFFLFFMCVCVCFIYREMYCSMCIR